MSTIEASEGKIITDVIPYVQAAISMQIDGNKDVAIPYLQGLPGMGKTALIQKLVSNIGANLVHCHFALLPLEDLSGIPQFKPIQFNEKEAVGTEWSIPELITKICRAGEDGKPVVVFLDDFHLCSPAHLELMFEMFTEWSLRGFELPAKTAFALAGNTSSKAGAKVQNSAISNRIASYPVRIDFEAWKRFAIKNDVNRKIVAFLSKDIYRSHIEEEELVNEQFGSARSWTRLSYLLNPLEKFKKGDVPTHELLYISKAHVGKNAASKFASFYKLFSSVNTEELFKVGSQYEISIPKEMDKLYIFIMAVCSEFSTCMYAQFESKNANFPIDHYYDVAAKIILMTANESKDMALVAIQEIIIHASAYNQYTKVEKKLRENMMRINSKLTEEIYNVTDELV